MDTLAPVNASSGDVVSRSETSSAKRRKVGKESNDSPTQLAVRLTGLGPGSPLRSSDAAHKRNASRVARSSTQESPLVTVVDEGDEGMEVDDSKKGGGWTHISF